MLRLVIATIVIVGCFCPGYASAAVSLTEWGATARTDSADCTGGGCSSILFLALEDGETVGGAGDTTATIGSVAAGSATGLQGRGTAGAEVVIPGAGLSIPILRARAESTDGSGFVSGAALGVQGYQFTGADGTLLSLDATLTGTVANPAASAVTGLEVNLWILTDTDLFTFPTDSTPVEEVIGGIIVDAIFNGQPNPFEPTLGWDVSDTGSGVINLSTAPGGSREGDRLIFEVNNGDEFYLFAGLSASATGVGGSALSWSTLTLEFDSDELSAASVVPVPAAIWFLGSGLVGLFGLRSRI